jgi:DNA-binding response OmpR family regulator
MPRHCQSSRHRLRQLDDRSAIFLQLLIVSSAVNMADLPQGQFGVRAPQFVHARPRGERLRLPKSGLQEIAVVEDSPQRLPLYPQVPSTDSEGGPMIVIVDERELVKDGYHSLFNREGVASAGFGSFEFDEWVTSVAEDDLKAVRAFIIGECCAEQVSPSRIRDRSSAPVIALSDQPSLENTLKLFESGVDDVVRKPVHIRELLARIAAIGRRKHEDKGFAQFGALRIFMDGRDPDINGEPLPLPRRERRILEFLASNAGRRVTKSQVFNSIYGIFDEDVEENVVESHISKLRKKLREKLGHDPIDSKRFLGYRLVTS